jgi:phosphatidylserine/phosphatidylglycerophosphate/cardiolipin synthase-like enzyme
MTIAIKAFPTSDDAFVVWESTEPIADCVGFQLLRKRNGGQPETVRNRVTFSAEGADPTHPSSSDVSPLRRYAWTDHEPTQGDTVAYQVIPVIQVGNGNPAPQPALASPFSADVTLAGSAGQSVECYFNRGFVISQFMSRILKGDLSAANLRKFKKDLNDETENKVRTFLAGDLRLRLFEVLDQAKADNGHVFAALFELSDEILIRKLEAFGDHAHVVLSNGPHDSAADDANEDSRARLHTAGCEMSDRLLPAKVLGHNKFLVVTDAARHPQAVWTGSTNWSPTGLCTQINNGILFTDPDVASSFLDQWEVLRAAGSKADKALATSNSHVRACTLGSVSVDVWFTRTTAAQEMAQVEDLIDDATDGILFLMFQPGSSPLLTAIVAREDDTPPLYIKGVVSTLDSQETDEAGVTLVRRGEHESHKFQIVQPQGVHGIGRWAAEVTRGAFLNQIGFAIVHSKIIVIDPFGQTPVVVTGSHNFSAAATSKNDENLVIVRGNAALAQMYASHIQAVYDHYQFRAVAAALRRQQQDVTEFFKDPKGWQASWFKDPKAQELEFWLRS